MAQKLLHAIVSGRVQGVFFRASAREEALRLGLGGWVRNLPDGGVEVEAIGPTDRLQAFLLWLHGGPAAARVEGVDAQWREAPDAPPPSFTIAG